MNSSSRVKARTLRTGSPVSVGMSGARLRDVGRLVGQWVDEGVAQTIEVLIARRGTIVLHEVHGKLTPAADSPQTPINAIFPVASITKLFTAASVMCLVEDGKVGLNRPVAFYIPEFKGKGKEAVTVRHLLTHTSGLQQEDVEAYALEQEGKLSMPSPDRTIHPLVQQYLSLRFGASLSRPAGSEMAYADFNFDLLAEIARRVSRASLDSFADSRVFGPIGMIDTHYCRVDAPADRRVRRPPDPPDPFSVPSPMSVAAETERVYIGSGLALSTALDIAKFGQMFLNGGYYGRNRVLSPITVAEMTRNQIPGIGATFFDQVFPEASWGLGWSVHGSKTTDGSLYSPHSFEHWGAGGTYTWVDPKLQLVGVYFSSTARTQERVDTLRYWRNDLFADAVTSTVEEV